MIDVVEEVAEGRACVGWSTVRSTHNGMTLLISVFQDAMKFDKVPALEWDFENVRTTDPWYTPETFDGVRLPASATQLQKIADLTGCMLLTPKVIDLMWLQAELRFDPVINTAKTPTNAVHRVIVAESHIHVVHRAIEKEIEKRGGNKGQLTECVGKYWCLINHLTQDDLLYGEHTACNYGWPSSRGMYVGVTSGIKVWQPPGYKHNDRHWDPSQTIRLMYRQAILVHADGKQEIVDLHDVASDVALAPLLHHDPGKLRYLRQTGVPAPASDVALTMYAPVLQVA